MGLMVFANVVLRYVFDSGIAITEEVSRFIFVWLTFAGASLAMFEGLHLGVDAVINALPKPMRTTCQIVARFLMLACCVALLLGSLTATRLNLHNFAALSGIPVALMYSAGLFASIIMGGVIVKELWLIMNGVGVHHDAAAGQPMSEA
jgi:TRAP-type C4-dicarboxylate transport system permease small subunit